MAIYFSNPYTKNFLGHAPDWYKIAILGFLIINPIILYLMGPYLMGWLLVGHHERGTRILYQNVGWNTCPVRSS